MKALGNKKTVDDALDDPDKAAISDRLKVTLRFLKKLTLSPSEVTAADVKPLLEQGITKEAVRDAIYVTYLFNTYDRMADTFKWDIPEQGSFVASAGHLLKNGYR